MMVSDIQFLDEVCQSPILKLQSRDQAYYSLIGPRTYRHVGPQWVSDGFPIAIIFS